MYRAVTLDFHEHYVNLTNPKEVQKALDNIHLTFIHNPKIGRSEIYLNGRNVEGEIRKMYISENVSQVSAIPDVRRLLVAQQQKMGKGKGVVMEGRDIGTKVFPSAELKLFFQAEVTVRAHRRQLELMEKNQLVNIDEVMKNLIMRDEIDTTRLDSPLVKATDAIIMDTTFFTLEEQVDFIVELATSEMVRSNTGS
jgi:CMP/dCMP kinase